MEAQGERLTPRAGAPTQTRWHLVVAAEAETGSLHGSLGQVLHCTRDTALDDAIVRAHLQAHRLEHTPARAEGLALRVVAPAASPLSCSSPAGHWTALYAAPEAVGLGDDLTDAPDLARALERLPGAETWLRGALGQGAPGSATTLMRYPVLRGVAPPSGLDAPTTRMHGAYAFAAVSGWAADAALGTSFWSSMTAFSPEANTRLVARIAASEPRVLETLRRSVAAGATAQPDAADVVWGRILGEQSPLDDATLTAFEAGLARCSAADTQAACGPWTFGAFAAYFARRQDDVRLGRLAATTAALPRAWHAASTRSEVRAEALRASQSGRLPETAWTAARLVLAGTDDPPLRTGRCVGVTREVVSAGCRDARMLAASMLVGECSQETLRAAEAGLSTERHIAAAAAACVFVRCEGEARATARIQRARPGHRFNTVAMALVPRWCRAGDAGR